MMTLPSELAGGRVTINLGALKDNWRHLSHCAGTAECGAVVKANGYGCGVETVAKALHEAGCRTFFVAVPEEGLRLRSVLPEVQCYVLNGLFPDASEHFVKAGLTPVLSSMRELIQWADHAKSVGEQLSYGLMLDTGMTRLGISANEAEELAQNSALSAQIKPTLLMTHYACADDLGHPKTDVQRETFLQLSSHFPGVPKSAANSAASLQSDFPGHGSHAFEMVRPGIALYGGEALNNVPNPMKPVVTLEAKIMQIRHAKAGDTVGYGAAETLTRPSRIAYVSVGYADGYHRAASHAGVNLRAVTGAAHAHFNGHKLQGVGRISMDMSGFDVTDIPEDEIAAGDWIELFGPNVPVDDVARASGTIGYELLTGLGGRYERRFID